MQVCLWGVIRRTLFAVAAPKVAYLHTLSHGADLKGCALDLAAFRRLEDRPALDDGILVALPPHHAVPERGDPDELRQLGKIAGNSCALENGIEQDRAFRRSGKVFDHEIPAFLRAPEVSRGGGGYQNGAIALGNRLCQDLVQAWRGVDHGYIVVASLIHEVNRRELEVPQVGNRPGGRLLRVAVQNGNPAARFFERHGQQQGQSRLSSASFLVT